MAAIVEQHEALLSDVVEGRDRDPIGTIRVVAPVDQEDRRLDAGKVRGVVAAGLRLAEVKPALVQGLRIRNISRCGPLSMAAKFDGRQAGNT